MDKKCKKGALLTVEMVFHEEGINASITFQKTENEGVVGGKQTEILTARGRMEVAALVLGGRVKQALIDGLTT